MNNIGSSKVTVAKTGDEPFNGQPSVKRILLIKLRYLGDVSTLLGSDGHDVLPLLYPVLSIELLEHSAECGVGMACYVACYA